MKVRMSIVALATVAVGLLSAAPALAHTDTICGTYVCETVTNSYQGSNYVDNVYVYDKYNPNNLYGTYAWLVRSQIRGQTQAYGGVTFIVNYAIDANSCVEGQITGYGNSTCWFAP